jgi:hypothetical protein
MYVIALKDQVHQGLYAVENEKGVKILYLFSEEDDAERFAGLLEADDYPELEVIEVEERYTIKICQENNYTYMIINPDDLLIPPDYHDSVQED